MSVTLSPELRTEIESRATERGVSLNRTILQLLRAGLEAEKDKKHRLEELLRRYRESSDPQEAERLAEQLGSMIFGR